MCLICNNLFKAKKNKIKFCSRECSNKNRRGKTYSKDSWGNKSKQRLNLLKSTFNFESCMVEGCVYNKTYDIHRVIEGKDGGEYVIGNMFAICPNHHAEVTRKIIELEIVNNYTLRIRE